MTKKAMVTMIRELINAINEVRAEYYNYMQNVYYKDGTASYESKQVISQFSTQYDSRRFFEVEKLTDAKMYKIYDNMDMQLIIDCLNSLLEGCKRQLELRQWEIQRHEELEAKKISEKKIEVIEESQEDNKQIKEVSNTLATLIIPTNTDINNNIIYNSYFMNEVDNKHKTIIKEIKALDNEIDLLEDRRIKLSKYLRNELNIKCKYNQCSDIKECREYVELNKLMDNKEIELDQLINQRQQIESINYNSYKSNLIKVYGNNKYRIVCNNEIEFNNAIEPFKMLECNVIIFTLINSETSFIEVCVYKKEYDNELYNNSYNKVCNLEYEYTYADNKYLLLDEVLRLDNKVIISIINRYDKNDYKIYSRVYLSDNFIIERYINIRSNFVVLIEYLNGNTYNTTYTNYALGTHVNEITKEGQEYIDKINKKIDYNNMKLSA